MPNKNGSDKRIGIGIIKEAAIKLEKKTYCTDNRFTNGDQSVRKINHKNPKCTKMSQI